MKVQVSIEYLIIVSFSLMVLVPIILYLYEYSSIQREEYNLNLAAETVRKIGEAADYVYLQGEPAKMTLRVIIPKNLEEVKLINRTIIFRIRTKNRVNEVYYNSIGNVYGYIPRTEGEYNILIQAREGGVYINVSTS